MAETLVLDMGYQPHRVISWQRAVTMLFAGKVEVVAAYDEVVRSVSLAIPMPAVVRLLRRIHVRRRFRTSRANVLARDGYRCQYCGESLRASELSIDHVLPRCRGGRTEWENVVAACYPCNERKGDRLPEEAGMALRSRPRQPWLVPLIAGRAARGRLPEPWSQWLFLAGGARRGERNQR